MNPHSLSHGCLLQICPPKFKLRVWFFDHQKSPFLTTATFRQDSVFFRFPYLTFFFHTRALSDTLRRLRLMGLNRVCSMFVQCLFNVCSMVVQWLANGCHYLLWLLVSMESMNADAAAVSVSSPMSFVFWGLRLEFIGVVVFPGRRGNFLPRRGKFSPRRGKKSGCLVRRCDRVGFALVWADFFLHFQAGVISLAKKKVDVA